MIGDTLRTGPRLASEAFGFIDGWISAYNLYTPNGKEDTSASMSYNDGYRWIASWCRDNPSKDLADALFQLIITLEKK